MGLKFLGFVAVLYAVSALSDPDKALLSLKAAGVILKSLVPILAVVFLLTALLNSFIKAKTIAKYIGKESGIKGWLIAIISGILSHGPSYVWYPMLKEMRDHGAKEGLIIAFFYARSIKIPWIPLMIGYFGLLFTTLLYGFVLIASIIQGIIGGYFFRSKKSDKVKKS